MLSGKKEFELSLKDINKALKTDSTILSLLHGRAVIYYYLEKPEEVIKDCNKVLDKIDEEENSFLYYAVLGLKLLSEGDYRKSVEYYTKALEIQPDWAGGYSRRGNAYYYAGEIESATRDWEKAHEINPFYPFFPFAKELLKQKRK